jgi:hypothetical protein
MTQANAIRRSAQRTQIWERHPQITQMVQMGSADRRAAEYARRIQQPKGNHDFEL